MRTHRDDIERAASERIDYSRRSAIGITFDIKWITKDGEKTMFLVSNRLLICPRIPT